MTGISSDKKFEALHEHYNKTFAIIRESIKLRDKLMLLIFLVLALVVLYTFWPSDAVSSVSQIASQKLGSTVTLDTTFIGSVIWLALLIVVVRYTQTVVYIERQYTYIHRLEDELRKCCESDVVFTREGESYLENYPKYSDWMYLLYTHIFPVVLALIISARIIGEWVHVAQTNLFVLVLNSVVAFCVLISLGLYMAFMHRQNKSD